MAVNNSQFNLTIRVNGKEVKNTLNGVGKELRSLRARTKNLTEGTEEWYRANKELAKTEKIYDDMKKNQRQLLNDTKKNIAAQEDHNATLNEFGGNVSQMFSALKSGDLVGFREGMHGVAGGIKSAANAAWQFAKTPFGLIMVGLTGIVLAAKEWVKYNEAAREANAITQQITQLSGDALDEARIRATAIENTFGTDFKETLNVAKNLVNAFGITYEEAFDRIEDGLVRGGSQNGEFLDSLKEYPRLFAQAGFTVEDFQRIVNEGIDLGIYSDKLPDAIKEFSLSVMEETTASREALENAFGKQFTDKLFKDLKSGSITVKDALGLVAAEAENIGLNSQQAQQLTADLFRGAGEDAGGALVIFEAVNDALKDQADALTPLQQHLKDVADANRELEEAQNDALKSDSYNAFVNELEVTWIKAKADFYQFINAIAEGLVDADTAFRRFVFQSVQYVKDAFTIGADADWEALGKEFDEQQRKIEEAAAKQKEEEQKRQKEKEKQAQKNNPNNLAADQKALAAEKKRLDAIDALRKEYEKKEEDRLADSATKKAKLAEKRALDEAKRLRAGNDVIEQIKKEHSILIAEAEEEDQNKAEERLKAFEERKRELLNELELAKAETDQEKEELEEEQRLEKEEAALEQMQLTKAEKEELLELMEQNHKQRLLDIEAKYNEERAKENKKFYDELIAAEENLQAAKNNALASGINSLQGFFDESSGIYHALFLLEKGLAAGEVITSAAKGIAMAKANLATVPIVIPGTILPNPMYAVAAATTAKNILATKINAAAQLAAIGGATIQGFSGGGYTDMFGQGYKDGSGHEVAGVVHTNEYVVPEIVRRDPEVPQILDYLETKRKKKLGLYATGGDTANEYSSSGASSTSSSSYQMMMDMMQAFMQKLDQPLEAPIYFGPEAEMKRQEQQKKLDKLKESTQIK